MSQFDIKTHKPVVAAKSPIGIDVEEGKEYWICVCGKSENQPFCDGKHKTVEGHPGPKRYVAEKTGKVWFCRCNQAKDGGVLCDGSHKKLPGSVEAGDNYLLTEEERNAEPAKECKN